MLLFGDLDWPLNAWRWFVSIRWASCLYIPGFLRNTMADASCVQIKPAGNLRGDLELYDTTPHYTTSKKITNNKLLSSKSHRVPPWLMGYFHGITTQSLAVAFVFRLDALALSVIATAKWLAGWLAVTLRYCIKTAKPIWKLFRPSESPITLVSWDPCADTKFQGEPLQRGR